MRILAILLAASAVQAQLQTPDARCVHPFAGRTVVQYSETHCLPNVACAGARGRKCLIVLSQRGIQAYGYAALYAHELAHCNCPGWHR